jgi:hypothetical protein
MTAAWKLLTESELMKPSRAPAVISTGTLEMMASVGMPGIKPSRATITRWIHDLKASGKIEAVTKGFYLNRIGYPHATAADAAWIVRRAAFVSLTWVLEQAGITNNFGDTITCTVPTHRDLPNPQITDRRTEAGTFRFFAMPIDLIKPPRARVEDFRDLAYEYERASPEKAFLDMLYLGRSPRSRMQPPPEDIEFGRLNAGKLRRLAKAMMLEEALAQWQAGRRVS